MANYIKSLSKMLVFSSLSLNLYAESNKVVEKECEGDYSNFVLNKDTGYFENGKRKMTMLDIELESSPDTYYDIEKERFCTDMQATRDYISRVVSEMIERRIIEKENYIKAKYPKSRVIPVIFPRSSSLDEFIFVDESNSEQNTSVTTNNDYIQTINDEDNEFDFHVDFDFFDDSKQKQRVETSSQIKSHIITYDLETLPDFKDIFDEIMEHDSNPNKSVTTQTIETQSQDHFELSTSSYDDNIDKRVEEKFKPLFKKLRKIQKEFEDYNNNNNLDSILKQIIETDTSIPDFDFSTKPMKIETIVPLIVPKIIPETQEETNFEFNRDELPRNPSPRFDNIFKDFGSIETGKSAHQKSLEDDVHEEKIKQEQLHKSNLFKQASAVYYKNLQFKIKSNVNNTNLLKQLYGWYMPEKIISNSQITDFNNIQELNSRIRFLYEYLGEIDQNKVESEFDKALGVITDEINVDKTLTPKLRIKYRKSIKDFMKFLEHKSLSLRNYKTDYELINKLYVDPLLNNFNSDKETKQSLANYLKPNLDLAKVSTKLNWINLLTLNKDGKFNYQLNDRKDNLGLVQKSKSKNVESNLNQLVENDLEILLSEDVILRNNGATQINVIKYSLRGGESRFIRNINENLIKIGQFISFARLDDQKNYSKVINSYLKDLQDLLLDKKSVEDEGALQNLWGFLKDKVSIVEKDTKITELEDIVVKETYNQFFDYMKEKNKLSILNNINENEFKKLYQLGKKGFERLLSNTKDEYLIKNLKFDIQQTSGWNNLPRFNMAYRNYKVKDKDIEFGMLSFTIHNKKRNNSVLIPINPLLHDFFKQLIPKLKSSKFETNEEYKVKLSLIDHFDRISNLNKN